MSDQWPVELSRAAAALFAGAAESRAESLHRLTEVAGWRVPGCCGASATFWENRMTALAATHPDLAALAERQVAAGARGKPTRSPCAAGADWRGSRSRAIVYT